MRKIKFIFYDFDSHERVSDFVLSLTYGGDGVQTFPEGEPELEKLISLWFNRLLEDNRLYWSF